MDTSFLPFTPNFSATHSVIIHRSLEEVFQKFGTAEAHPDVCALSSLCTSIAINEKDIVALAPGQQLQEASFLKAPKAADNAAGDAFIPAERQHFRLVETIPVLFNLVKSDVIIRGTLTWTQPSPESFATGGPVYSVYESEVVGGLAVQIYRLRKMETVDVGDGQKATKLTEYLQGIGPWYMRPLIAKEAISKHRAHLDRYPDLF